MTTASAEVSGKPVATSAAPIDVIAAAVLERVRELGRSGGSGGCTFRMASMGGGVESIRAGTSSGVAVAALGVAAFGSTWGCGLAACRWAAVGASY